MDRRGTCTVVGLNAYVLVAVTVGRHAVGEKLSYFNVRFTWLPRPTPAAAWSANALGERESYVLGLRIRGQKG